jgi:hypothetical protein
VGNDRVLIGSIWQAPRFIDWLYSSGGGRGALWPGWLLGFSAWYTAAQSSHTHATDTPVGGITAVVVAQVVRFVTEASLSFLTEHLRETHSLRRQYLPGRCLQNVDRVNYGPPTAEVR